MLNMNSYKKQGNCAIAVILVIAFMLAGVASGFIYLNSLPPISQLKNYQPTLVSQIVANDDTVIKTFGAYKYEKASIKDIPDNFKKAIIATEDKKFYKHSGFDPLALVRSTLSNLLAGHVVQGASTITQQLARILFLSSEKTFDRKLKELIIAYRLEKTLPKDEILEMYLNNVYLGEGAYGVAAASKIYFNKSPKDLTLAEAALIAGLPQAPSIYSPYYSMKAAKNRRHQVLERMVKMNYIDEKTAQEADKAEIKLNITTRPYSLNKAPYFVEYAMKELKARAGLTEQEVIQGGYKVYTTLNIKNQEAAQNKLVKGMVKWGLTKPYQQAALISIDAVTGKILAYVGGKDFGISQYDRVTQAIRQPGSAFKMFVYTAAVEKGFTPQTIIEDKPIKLGNWSPHNYGNKYRGKIPLYKALAFSSNAAAVQLIMQIGVEDTITMARRLGITTYIAADPTIALGSSGVKLIELTSAFGVLANGGVKVEPYTIEKVEDSNGRIIYQANTSNYRKVLDNRTVSYMVEMLKTVVKIGTGRAANIGRPVAGKTGTTDSYRDAWFVGFTPEIVTGVWVGNDNNTPTKKLTGGSIPASIWADYMKAALAGKPVTDFSYPELVIDSKTKIIDVNNQSKVQTEVMEEYSPKPDSEEIDEDVIVPSSDGQSSVVEEQSTAPIPLPSRKESVSSPPVPSSKQNAGNVGY
jgi:penicillin-binding protein 1A